jgi:hypothetical protein
MEKKLFFLHAWNWTQGLLWMLGKLSTTDLYLQPEEILYLDEDSTSLLDFL